MNPPWWLQIVIAAGGVLGAWLTARLASKAQTRSVDASKEIGAGQLALEWAKRADAKAEQADLKADRQGIRISTLEARERQVSRWWGRHEPRDRMMEEHLGRLDPTLAAELPPYEPLPELDTPPEGTPRVT